MSAILIDNVRLLDPASGRDGGGRVLVEDGRIAALDPRHVPQKGVDRIDGHGRILAPGFIDMRSFAVDAPAALAGGITTVVLMPDQAPAIDTAAKVQFARDPDPATPSVRVEVMGAATQETAGTAMAEIGLMAEAGAVGFTDGRRAIADALLMRRLLEYARLVDRPLVQHAEDPALAAGGAMNEGEIATRLGLPGIPAAAEAIMIERDARLVRLTGGRLHIAQVSAAESVEVLRRIRREDGAISAGVSPHHFTLNETAVGDYRTFAKVSPPLRGEADRRALVEAIRDGVIDVICSAHEPRDQDAKRLPFSEAAPGIVGYETLLPLTLALHHHHDVPLLPLIGMLTARPAALLGLAGGRIAEGAPADLVLFDPDRPWRIDPTRFRSETQNTPFTGMPVAGRIEMTMVGGRILFREEGA